LTLLPGRGITDFHKSMIEDFRPEPARLPGFFTRKAMVGERDFIEVDYIEGWWDILPSAYAI